MSVTLPVALLVALLTTASGASAQSGAERVAGIQLYPGASGSNVEGSEKTLRSTGYKTAVCRHTGDSLAKVVAFYRNDKNISLLYEPSKDNAGFVAKSGASMSINSPWLDPNTFKTNNGTLICIAHKDAP